MILPLHLFSWKIKGAFVVAVVLASAWYVQHAKTVAYEQGVASGRKAGWADAEKQQRDAWATEWEKIRQDMDRLAAIEQQQTTQRLELDRTRAGIARDLTARLAEIATRNMEQRQDAATIPPSDLIPRIKHTLDDLDLLERQRANRTDRPTTTTN